MDNDLKEIIIGAAIILVVIFIGIPALLLILAVAVAILVTAFLIIMAGRIFINIVIGFILCWALSVFSLIEFSIANSLAIGILLFVVGWILGKLIRQDIKIGALTKKDN